ncbi:MAG: acyltransferase family protein, partial [Prevotella sp.]
AENSGTMFFFLSGYLFCSGRKFSLRGKLSYILRRLVLPYFLFTIPISVIKPFVHGETLSITDIVTSEITGHASWFVAALVTAELLFSLMLWKFGRNKAAICISSVVMLMFSVIFGNMEGGYIYNKVNIWHINEAFMAFFCMGLGFVYKMDEERLDGFMKIPVLLVLGAVLIVFKYYENSIGMSMIVSPVIISCYPVFLADIIIFFILFVKLAKSMPEMPYMTFVGRNSLYHYFLCGASPTLVGIVMTRFLPYDGNCLLLFSAFVLSMTLCSLAVKAILLVVERR